MLKTRKPIILSTGLSNIKEIKEAIKIINKYHNKVIIMHCVSEYPTKLENINFQRINKLKKIFKKFDWNFQIILIIFILPKYH